MKKIILSMGVLAMMGLCACSNKEKEADTAGAVDAEVVATDVQETDIIITEDTAATATAAEQANQDLNDAVTEADDAAKQKGEEPADKALSDKADEAADKLSE